MGTAADSLAGLERMNPFEVMMSRRYQKTPQSQQFMELFRYISGVNQNQEEIEMTRPVVVFHNITKETSLGNYENQTMCFYLPRNTKSMMRRVKTTSRPSQHPAMLQQHRQHQSMTGSSSSPGHAWRCLSEGLEDSP